jgi:hypothetical protein
MGAENERQRSVNNLCVLHIYFAVESTPQLLAVSYLMTVLRALTARWPYFSDGNGELKVGVTSALLFFSEYIFGGWKQREAVICFAGSACRCVTYDRLLQLKRELKMSVNQASTIFVYCIYFAVESTPPRFGVSHLPTGFRALTARWTYYSHCNGELKVGVTSALHILCIVYVGQL